MKQYWLYMITNRWKNVLYTGVTNSLEKRVWQHKNSAVPGFTKQYNCHFLVYFEEYDRIEQAIAREKQIKGWSRAKKDFLIAQVNPEWKDLAADWYAPPVIPSEVEGSPPSEDAPPVIPSEVEGSPPSEYAPPVIPSEVEGSPSSEEYAPPVIPSEVEGSPPSEEYAPPVIPSEVEGSPSSEEYAPPVIPSEVEGSPPSEEYAPPVIPSEVEGSPSSEE